MCRLDQYKVYFFIFISCHLLITISDRLAPTYRLNTIKLLDKQILGMHQHPEHAPILLAWMLFNCQCNEEDIGARIRQFGTRAVQLGVFEYLYDMICHQIYSVNCFLDI